MPSDTATTAAAVTPSAGEQLLNTFSMFGPILIIFYFLLIRPQQKKAKEHQAMVAGLARGDKVLTAGGIIGKVTKVNNEKASVSVQIADGVEIEVLSATIASKLGDVAKPINDNSKDKKKK